MVFTVIVFLFSLTISAQGKKGNNRKGQDLTSEQMATLQSKRMTLMLDLDANQQKSVEKLFLKSAKERELSREEFRQKKQSGEMNSNDRFNAEKNRLEKQLAHKAEMKKILNKDQYDKWEKTMMKRSKSKKSQANSNKNPRGNKQGNNNAPKQFNNKG